MREHKKLIDASREKDFENKCKDEIIKEMRRENRSCKNKVNLIKIVNH